MLDLISDAITARRLLTFRYDDENRLVEPHACGFTAKGKAVFRGFQPAGGTHRELGWKLFSIDKIEELHVLTLTFDKPRDGYRPGDKQIAEILAELQLEEQSA